MCLYVCACAHGMNIEQVAYSVFLARVLLSLRFLFHFCSFAIHSLLWTLDGSGSSGSVQKSRGWANSEVCAVEVKKPCIRTINCGPENMRDNNVTFNTLLKDNKNQVKRDSLQFALLVHVNYIVDEKKKCRASHLMSTVCHQIFAHPHNVFLFP